jgi:hypothetical protein
MMRPPVVDARLPSIRLDARGVAILSC